MHLAFMPYGIKNFCDFLIEDLNHKYLPMRLYKDGEEDKQALIQTQVRILPFGIYELVFPREFKNEVLSALKINSEKCPYNLDKSILGIKPMNTLRNFLNLKPIPDYEKVSHPNFPIPEYIRFVTIIPIGIREDKDMTETTGDLKGWNHEGI